MELSWGLLLALMAFFALAVFWQDALGTRERANDAARETCASTGAALLDDTVAFRSLKLVRGSGGRYAFERTYLFEYTLDGETRRQGFVVMFGRRVDSIGLEPVRSVSPFARPGAKVMDPSEADASNVRDV